MSTIDNANKRKRGRPPADTEAVTLRLTRDMIAMIEKDQVQHGDRSRPEAIRRILADYLKGRGYLPK